MKRKCCEECGVGGGEMFSNQSYDSICGDCHDAVYFDCECGAKTLQEYDEEENHCVEREHCQCESCVEIHPLYDCIGCGDTVNKPKDCDTVKVLDICRYCLFTMCLVCHRTMTDSNVCIECISRSKTFQLLSLRLVPDIAHLVLEYMIPRRSIELFQDRWRKASESPFFVEF
jgi:hypothetical protein